jgi:hypothetical protein
MNQTKKDPSQGGRGLAIAGLVIGIVWLVIQILYWSALLALLGMEA